MADGIGGRIARRRQALRMTQEELAARIGVSRATVANWETGKHFPKRKLGLVEQVLGISLADDSPQGDPVPESLKRSIRRDLSDLEPEAAERVIDAVRRTLEEADGSPPGLNSPGRHRAV